MLYSLMTKNGEYDIIRRNSLTALMSLLLVEPPSLVSALGRVDRHTLRVHTGMSYAGVLCKYRQLYYYEEYNAGGTEVHVHLHTFYACSI